ncbi:MAG: hypothetical protein JWL84_5801 [Rhodospirillales bacterium]|jgi:hypothetical protein|nr:hypothetical protein [Rhodospirillales bacterium]
MDSIGWAIWCRETASKFRRGSRLTAGPRSRALNDLAAHYEAQADQPETAMAGDKPAIRDRGEPPKSPR